MDRDGSPGDNGRNDIAVCHITAVRRDQLAVGVGNGTVLDPGSHYSNHHNCDVVSGSSPGSQRNNEKEEVALSSMRRLKRQVARYRMKKAGAQKVNKLMKYYWKDCLRREK